VAGGWRRLHNEELHNSYAQANIVRDIKLRRMKLVGHGVRMGEMKNVYNIWLENLKGRDHLKDLGKEGRIVLKWILGK
jgi:hypothetical protein